MKAGSTRQWMRPRRDMCYLIGRRMQRLTPTEAWRAWRMLGEHMERLGEMDVPKFVHLITGMDAAALRAKRVQLRKKPKLQRYTEAADGEFLPLKEH